MTTRMNSSEHEQDSIVWNPKSSKTNHLKCSNCIDISEVFAANKAFLKNDTVSQTALTHNKNLS